MAASAGFLSTPSARRATCSTATASPFSRFLSTPSARRATVAADKVAHVFIISIHALREEGDKANARHSISGHRISIHALREEGDMTYDEQHVPYGISIHALREEGDSSDC